MTTYDDVVENPRTRPLHLADGFGQAGREELSIGGVDAVDTPAIDTRQDDWPTLPTTMTVSTLGHDTTVLRMYQWCDQTSPGPSAGAGYMSLVHTLAQPRPYASVPAWHHRENRTVAYRALSERVHSTRMFPTGRRDADLRVCRAHRGPRPLGAQP